MVGDAVTAAILVAKVEKTFTAGRDACDQTTMSPDGSLAQTFIIVARFGRHLPVGDLCHYLSSNPVANSLPIEIGFYGVLSDVVELLNR
jgi:hypothetical protein